MKSSQSFFKLVGWHIRIKGDKWSSTVCHTAATEKKFENMSFTKSSPSSDRRSFEGGFTLLRELYSSPKNAIKTSDIVQDFSAWHFILVLERVISKKIGIKNNEIDP